MKKTPPPLRDGTDIVDVREWADLGARLLQSCPDKFDEILDALRETVDAQEIIAKYDWQLFLRSRRPGKTYEA